MDPTPPGAPTLCFQPIPILPMGCSGCFRPSAEAQLHYSLPATPLRAIPAPTRRIQVFIILDAWERPGEQVGNDGASWRSLLYVGPLGPRRRRRSLVPPRPSPKAHCVHGSITAFPQWEQGWIIRYPGIAPSRPARTPATASPSSDAVYGGWDPLGHKPALGEASGCSSSTRRHQDTATKGVSAARSGFWGDPTAVSSRGQAQSWSLPCKGLLFPMEHPWGAPTGSSAHARWGHQPLLCPQLSASQREMVPHDGSSGISRRKDGSQAWSTSCVPPKGAYVGAAQHPSCLQEHLQAAFGPSHNLPVCRPGSSPMASSGPI